MQVHAVKPNHFVVWLSLFLPFYKKGVAPLSISNSLKKCVHLLRPNLR